MSKPPATLTPAENARRCAAEVFVLGFPLLVMDAIRRSHPLVCSGFPPLSPSAEEGAPGLAQDDPDCLLTSSVIDLTAGPAILHLPDTQGRYLAVTLIDSAGEAFGSLGARTREHFGADVALAGPDWRGEIADGVRAIRAPCSVVWAVSRLMGHSAADRAKVEALAARQCVTPLSKPPECPPRSARPAQLDSVDLTPVRQAANLAPETLFHRTPQLLERAPHAFRERVGPQLRSALSWLTAAEPTRDFVQACLRGFADGWDAIQTAVRKDAVADANGWVRLSRRESPDPATAGVLHAAGVVASLGGPASEDILTLSCDTDESHRELVGQEQYRLHFAASDMPPALSAWRLSARALPAGEPVAVIGDHSPLVLAPDGSLELFVQADPPQAAQAANWLRCPAGPFRLSIRLYWPAPEALSGSWRMPAVERLGSRSARHNVVRAALLRRRPPMRPRKLGSSAAAAINPAGANRGSARAD